jgi:cytoskeletal protein CcmA (bactofilin family)
VAVLVFAAGLMLMLPLVPALLELRRESDALPLNVVQQNAGEIRHFANSFRAYIKGLGPIIQRCVASGTTDTGTLPDGEQYVVLGRADEPLIHALQQHDAIRPVVIASGVDLSVSAEGTLSRDIYAGGQFQGGDKSSYRAILGEQNVRLGVASRVLRWVHAVGEFTAGPSCRLQGRISSDSLIRLHADCSFLRLNAPRIEFGQAATHGHAEQLNSSVTEPGLETYERLLHDGDFEVPARQVINRNIVIRGKLRIRTGARVCGSVKSEKDMVLENGVSIEGSLISASKMRIGPHCLIHGPVIAERELAIATGTRCGTLEHPTTVSAPRIEVEEGVVVFGTLWARERGQVVNP